MLKIKEILPESIATKLRCLKYEITRNYNFKKYHNYKLCISSPKTFNEKLYYRKYFGNQEFMADKADKYLVRDYVEKKVGKEILIPLLGCYDVIDESIWSNLPEKFVLKTNHGSGSDHIEIVKSKSESNKHLIIEKMNKAVRQSFGKLNHQPFYDLIERKILVEEYLETEKYTPDDYKFHVFKNEVFIQVDVGRYTEHKRSLYDVNWRKLDFKLNSKYDFASKDKPENLDEMIAIARALAEGYDYVRIDLYNVHGKIYFGEITQTHGNGTENFEPPSKDLEWGKLWILDKNNKNLYK
ncbi:hypothetical protein V8073_000897 [Vibrio parahaemolyticus]|uniref:Uncharacterized protein n=1 Tax=Vibrio parahaemolyticus TaxID=670 RepID=A0A7M1VSJ9_VIBPH|nr:ATP-grasp fold amidoligase family protein [Vibrio parahaemolyticus]EHH2462944.1 hypothetical protein [Vibrio parahaemolyticus]EHR6440933.1 hypothetical protein [Vibrio parahaemolyticus]EIU6868202.1 hypothetical protein [Vibrio parahaemolyticus]MBE3909334.1 hypothetical protein [Vibrio parahaemolyticus]MBM4939178.1 hypothetical protein [Vibrio parahaemolyticus]